MKREYRKAITKLKNLATQWPDGISLFSSSGSLLVIKDDNGEILEYIYGIPNDGGDPGSRIEGDKEYVNLT